MKLTCPLLLNAKPKAKPYKLTDRDSMYLYVSIAGTKTGKFDFRLDDKACTYTLGRFRALSLHDARELRGNAAKLVGAGIHPKAHQRQLQQQTIAHHKHTFCAWLSTLACGVRFTEQLQGVPGMNVASTARRAFDLIGRSIDRDHLRYSEGSNENVIRLVERSRSVHAAYRQREYLGRNPESACQLPRLPRGLERTHDHNRRTISGTAKRNSTMLPRHSRLNDNKNQLLTQAVTVNGMMCKRAIPRQAEYGRVECNAVTSGFIPRVPGEI